MKELKTCGNVYFGYTMYLETENGTQLKVKFIYTNNGTWDLHCWVANNPQNKIFKHWEHFAWEFINEDSYPTIKDMIISVVTKKFKDYEEKEKVRLTRLRKWQEFEKSLDKKL